MTDSPRAPDPAAPDPQRCPLCGGPNGCAMACGGGATTGGQPCWCTAVQIAPQTLARIPAAARGVACLCRTCATAHPAS